MTINGVNLEIDIFDAEKAGAYERAQKSISKLHELMTSDLSLEEKIKKACATICKEIDNLFGKGTSTKLVDNKNNLRDVSAVWKDITINVTQQLEAESKSVFCDSSEKE